METNFLKLYLELSKTLVKTLVIKCEKSANSVNDLIKLKYGEDSVEINNPRSWKYYLNLSGEYHPLDTPMVVTSLDTMEPIVFSKENLLAHSATKEQYQYQTRYYYSLLEKYPDQEQLILGILYPVDIDKAISAEDGSILGYPEHLVEPQEITLIPELESFIKRYNVRWDVKAFAISDSLYNTAQKALLYMSLVPKLLNLRLKRCKTNEVHSFHIREYLASHGGLDKYLPYMTLKQSLYLYRNISYIERNSGQVDQFKTLVEKLLTDRRIPLSELSVRQLSSFDAGYQPEITVRRKPVNAQFNIPEVDHFNLTELFEKEKPLVYGNISYLDLKAANVEHTLKNSISSVMQSKDLESSMVDYNGAVPDPLETVLLRQWAYMASHGLYNAMINFKDPKTSELRSLHALDAFIYMNYIWWKSIDIDVVTIPPYINIKFRGEGKPTLTRMLSVVDRRFTDLPALAQQLLDSQPNIALCRSSKNFFDLNFKVYEEALKHWFLISHTEDHYKRALVSNMVATLYADEAIEFPVTTTVVADWLVLNNLPVYDYTYAQAQELVQSIFAAATGTRIESGKILANIQRAMLAILQQLSSYSIQFIREINANQIRPINWAAIRLGNPNHKVKSSEHAESGIDLIELKGSTSEHYQIESVVNKNFDYFKGIEHIDYQIPIKLTVTRLASDTRTSGVYFDSFRLAATYPGYDPVMSDKAKFIGWEYYMSLTDTQKSQILSIYD